MAESVPMENVQADPLPPLQHSPRAPPEGKPPPRHLAVPPEPAPQTTRATAFQLPCWPCRSCPPPERRRGKRMQRCRSWPSPSDLPRQSALHSRQNSPPTAPQAIDKPRPVQAASRGFRPRPALPGLIRRAYAVRATQPPLHRAPAPSGPATRSAQATAEVRRQQAIHPRRQSRCCRTTPAPVAHPSDQQADGSN